MATYYRFRLDPSSQKVKYRCPQCGKDKKFVKYIDVEGRVTFPDHVGRCDREEKCGYHYGPEEYFQDNAWLCYDSRFTRSVAKPIVASPVQRSPSFIPSEVMAESLAIYESSTLYRFIASLWGENEATRLFTLYNVGGSRQMAGGTVFWQVDIGGRIRTGKAMRYDNTGHRVKTDGTTNFLWYHRIKSVVAEPSDFNLVQCFFGEHLLSLKPDAKVMIVESEKSAFIASHFYPQFVWLASGGSSGCLNANASQVLKGREVWLVPDLKAEDKWERKLAMLREITPSAKLSTHLSAIATAEQRAAGLDIADFLLSVATGDTSCNS